MQTTRKKCPTISIKDFLGPAFCFLQWLTDMRGVCKYISTLPILCNLVMKGLLSLILYTCTDSLISIYCRCAFIVSSLKATKRRNSKQRHVRGKRNISKTSLCKWSKQLRFSFLPHQFINSYISP